jgi:hypothetical protein
MSHIFRNEYIDRVNQPLSSVLRTRVDAITRLSAVTFDEQTEEVSIDQVDNSDGSFLLHYFNRMGHSIGDAYLIVLFALEEICEGNHVINETKLINELHQATLQMYHDRVIKEMSSCLTELL